ncbi:MAG: terminase gpA endonuclease subunit, partial [Pseudomonadota bacterium]
GFTRLEWQKLRERNEALDCRVYARAAAWIAGADRWSEAMWRDLESQVCTSHDDGLKQPNVEVEAQALAGIIHRKRERRPRRVFRSSYLI